MSIDVLRYATESAVIFTEDKGRLMAALHRLEKAAARKLTDEQKQRFGRALIVFQKELAKAKDKYSEAIRNYTRMKLGASEALADLNRVLLSNHVTVSTATYIGTAKSRIRALLNQMEDAIRIRGSFADVVDLTKLLLVEFFRAKNKRA